MRGDSSRTAGLGAPLAATGRLVLVAGGLLASFLVAPVAGGTPHVLSSGQVVLASPGGDLTAPADGRLRGQDFAGEVTGVAWPASVVAGGTERVAGAGRRLVEFTLRLSQPAGDVTALDKTTVATASVEVGQAEMPVDLSSIDTQIGAADYGTAGTGTATFALSVPERTHDVVVSLSERGFTQRFDLWTLERVPPAPVVLYRTTRSATIAASAPVSVPLTVTNPADGYTTTATLTLSKATLSAFAPDGTTPASPTTAFLIADLAVDGPWNTTPPYSFSTLAPLPGSRLTFAPDGGAPVTASTAPLPGSATPGPANDGLLERQYWFPVPATVTSGTLAVTSGTATGTEYHFLNPIAPTATLELPQTTTLSVDLPAPSTNVIRQPTPPWVGRPAPQAAASGTGPTGGTRAASALGSSPGSSGGFPVWLAVLLVALVAAGLVTVTRFGRRRRMRANSGTTGPQPNGIGHDPERLDIDSSRTTTVGPAPPIPPPGAPIAPPIVPPRAPTAPPIPPTAPAEPVHPTVAIAEHPQPLGQPGTPAVRVMGTVEITGWEEPSERRAVLQELCTYLALHSERGFSTEQLAIPLDSTAKTVRNNLYRLRRALGADHLPDATLSPGYRLLGVATDWGRFRELTDRASHAGDADGLEAERLLAEALSHVRGVPFAGVSERQYGWAFSEPLANDITAAIVDAAHRLAEHRLVAGDRLASLAAARKGLLASPTELALWSDLVTATAASGERSGVRRILAEAARVLDPDDAAELAALAQRLQTTPVGEGGPSASTP